MAKTPPRTASHQGALTGRFSASKSPVTAALPSATVTGLCIPFSYKNSAATQTSTVSTIKNNAFGPKCQIPNKEAGKSAISTHRIKSALLSCALTCGDDDTFLKSFIASIFLLVSCALP